jgi:hypothetical protein
MASGVIDIVWPKNFSYRNTPNYKVVFLSVRFYSCISFRALLLVPERYITSTPGSEHSYVFFRPSFREHSR